MFQVITFFILRCEPDEPKDYEMKRRIRWKRLAIYIRFSFCIADVLLTLWIINSFGLNSHKFVDILSPISI